MVEAAVVGHGGGERPLPGVAERRMAEIVGKRQRLGEILVQRQRSGDVARDLRDFYRMGQAGAVVVAFVEQEDLRLVLQAAERGRVDDAVTVALELGPHGAGRLGIKPPAARRGVRGIGREPLNHHGSPRESAPFPGQFPCSIMGFIHDGHNSNAARILENRPAKRRRH